MPGSQSDLYYLCTPHPTPELPAADLCVAPQVIAPLSYAARSTGHGHRLCRASTSSLRLVRHPTSSHQLLLHPPHSARLQPKATRGLKVQEPDKGHLWQDRLGTASLPIDRPPLAVLWTQK